jgi:uncharacterized membrane protein YdjX (TVP38/TMEM64 family)
VDKTSLKRYGIIAGCVAAIIIAAAAIFAFETRESWMPLVAEARAWTQDWLRHVDPFVFFTMLAVVPVLPVPISLFYISTGIFPTPVAIIGILIAIPINFAITYWLAKSLMKPLAEKLLARADMKIPQFSSRKNGILFSIFIRVCGTPYTLQNYIIPLAGVSFRDYMIYGLPFQYIPAFAMMCLGDSIIHGGARKGILAVAVLVCVAIATKLTTDYLRRKKENPGGDAK